MSDEIELVEKLEVIWLKITPNVVTQLTTKGKKIFQLAFILNQYKIILRIIIGKRGGIKEQIFGLDTSQKITIKKLYIEQEDTFTGNLVQLKNIRTDIKAGADPEKIITESLQKLMQEIVSHPDVYLVKMKWISDVPGSSISALEGRIPGQGSGN